MSVGIRFLRLLTLIVICSGYDFLWLRLVCVRLRLGVSVHICCVHLRFDVSVHICWAPLRLSTSPVRICCPRLWLDVSVRICCDRLWLGVSVRICYTQFSLVSRLWIGVLVHICWSRLRLDVSVRICCVRLRNHLTSYGTVLMKIANNHVLIEIGEHGDTSDHKSSPKVESYLIVSFHLFYCCLLALLFHFFTILTLLSYLYSLSVVSL
jgi:hypothetical protein